MTPDTLPIVPDLLPLPPGEGWGEGQRRDSLTIVLDTNIILDVFLFNDLAAEPIRQALAANTLNWIATQAMREELARVLAYPKIVQRLNFYALTAEVVLSKFDQHTSQVDIAPKANVTCKDADDQKFIDLAVQHQALLISKDQHVLSMQKRLLAQGIQVQAAM